MGGGRFLLQPIENFRYFSAFLRKRKKCLVIPRDQNRDDLLTSYFSLMQPISPTRSPPPHSSTKIVKDSVPFDAKTVPVAVT